MAWPRPTHDSARPSRLLRTSRPTILTLALLATVTMQTAVVPEVVHAQTAKKKSLRDELPESVRGDWDKALELYNADNLPLALVQFERVYEASKHPRVLHNMGVLENKQNHYGRALELFQRELDEANGKLTAKEVQEVKETIKVLEGYVTALTIESSEAGAIVLVNGRQVGTTPLAKPVLVEIGKAQVRLVKDGFREFTQEVAVPTAGHPEKLTAKLQPVTLTALVEVTVTGAPNASIWIDGVDRGPAPFRGKLEVARHSFVARAPGFVEATQTTDVVQGDTLKIQLALAAERHEGKVRIVAKPAGAIIEIDQRVVGSTVWEGVLPAGGHQLRVTKPGYGDYVSDISLRDDQVRRVEATLTEDKSKGVWLWATGAVAVVAGGAIASYFVFQRDADPVQGTLAPYIVNTSYGFGVR